MSQNAEINFMSDVFVLANDIFENHKYQSHGFKIAFYYKFNTELKFGMLDGSVVAQTKLLERLRQENVLEFEITEARPNYSSDYMSMNALKFSDQNLLWIELFPNEFNNYFQYLKRYKVTHIVGEAEEHTLSLIMVDDTLILRDLSVSADYLIKTFRSGSVPGKIFKYLIEDSPNQSASYSTLELAGIRTKRKLGEVVRMALPASTQEMIIVESSNRFVKIQKKATVRHSEYVRIVNGLMSVQFK